MEFVCPPGANTHTYKVFLKTLKATPITEIADYHSFREAMRRRGEEQNKVVSDLSTCL